MLVTPQLAPVRVRVADFPLSATRSLGQVASPDELRIKFHDDGSCTVSLGVTVQRFELHADGSLGEPVGPAYVVPPAVVLRGDATTAVDPDGLPRYHLRAETLPATAHRPAVPGSVLNVATGLVETFGPGQDWLGYLQAKPEVLLLQSVAFGVQCAYEAVTIWELVEHYLQLADAAPSSFLPASWCARLRSPPCSKSWCRYCWPLPWWPCAAS